LSPNNLISAIPGRSKTTGVGSPAVTAPAESITASKIANGKGNDHNTDRRDRKL
jgi:hypothetical protein